MVHPELDRVKRVDNTGRRNTVLFENDDFAGTSKLLAKATIRSCDFEEVISETRQGDFVFIDPPYTVRHNANGFVKYNESIFSWADQIRLAAALKKKRSSGAIYVMTNAYHPSVIDLYGGFATTVPAERASVLSGDSQYRGPTREAIILIGDYWRDALSAERTVVRPESTNQLRVP